MAILKCITPSFLRHICLISCFLFYFGLGAFTSFIFYLLGYFFIIRYLYKSFKRISKGLFFINNGAIEWVFMWYKDIYMPVYMYSNWNYSTQCNCPEYILILGLRIVMQKLLKFSTITVFFQIFKLKAIWHRLSSRNF